MKMVGARVDGRFAAVAIALALATIAVAGEEPDRREIDAFFRVTASSPAPKSGARAIAKARVRIDDILVFRINALVRRIEENARFLAEQEDSTCGREWRELGRKQAQLQEEVAVLEERLERQSAVKHSH